MMVIDIIDDGYKLLTNKLIIFSFNSNQHGSYSSSTTNYDFSVLTLKTSLKYNSYVKSIGLASSGQDPVGVNALTSGWGATSEGGSGSYNLKSISLPILSNSECDNNYGSGSITSQMICAGYMYKSGSDSCQGDSGGPLVYNNRLVGVVSWGYGKSCHLDLVHYFILLTSHSLQHLPLYNL